MNNESTKGYIYILTNPSFPNFIKIGYADDVEKRVEQLNRSECTPFAFRVFATYEVNTRVKDLDLHKIIDSLNPELRSVENINGKVRKREFYKMTKEEAFNLLEAIASINGLKCNLKKWEETKEEKEDIEIANKIEKLFKKRHHFKDLEFTSSLTGKKYKGTTSESGTLLIIDLETNEEVINNANPSKKAILGEAIKDLGGTVYKDETLYQRYHKLMKMLK